MRAVSVFERALQLDPNYSSAYTAVGFSLVNLGRPKEAIEWIEKAMALDPYYTHDYPSNLGLAYYLQGKCPEAVNAFKDARGHNESAVLPRLFLASCYVRLGRQSDAEWEVEQVEIQSPETRLSQLATTLPLKNRDKLDNLLADLSKAGMQ